MRRVSGGIIILTIHNILRVRDREGEGGRGASPQLKKKNQIQGREIHCLSSSE